MDIFKKTISLESITSRTPDYTYGTITGDSIYVKIFITQNINDMGLFTDVNFYNEPLEEAYSKDSKPNTNNILVKKLLSAGIIFPFMTGATSTMTNDGFIKDLRISNSTLDTYTANTGTVTGITDSKLLSLRGYKIISPYIVGFDINKEKYVNYTGRTIDGVSRILSLEGPTGYTFDANNDKYIGTTEQNSGIYYADFNTFRNVLDTETNTNSLINITTMAFKGEGWNESNTTLSAITKEEMYFGITRTPEIKNDIFIDRGNTTVLESHMRFSEIRNMDELALYGNGYYKLITQ